MPAIQSAFNEAVDAYLSWNDGKPEPVIEVNDRKLTIPEVCGLVWNCRDFLPALTCYTFGLFDEPIRQGSSYAQAARRLKVLYMDTLSLAA